MISSFDYYYLFCTNLLLWLPISGFLNLYHTDQYDDRTSLQYDCLDYYVTDSIVYYTEMDATAHQLLAFCMRLERHHEQPKATANNNLIHGHNYTFRYLKEQNITGQQLHLWTATIELIERYEAYLNEGSAVNDLDIYYNCTDSWFGNRCEYSFHKIKGFQTLSNIVRETFRNKKATSRGQVPCYELLECNRGPSVLCLDWREICDGKIDCLNNGVDEENCWLLEKSDALLNNDNNKDDFLCHNGMQSISMDFYRNGIFNPDCIDRTDEKHNAEFWRNCFSDPAFRCEEHTCHPGRSEAILNCGDGECVNDLYKCRNQRGFTSMIKSIAVNISKVCADSMTCLTDMKTFVDDGRCDGYCFGRCASQVKTHCPSIFRFPTNFTLLNHIFFVYTSENANEKADNILPTYICYDLQQCGFTRPLVNLSFTLDGNMCAKFDEFGFNYEYFPILPQLIRMVEDIFLSQCSARTIGQCPDNNFYQCINSSKCISKRRLLDGIQDCMANDDEMYADSCLLNDKFRFQCSEQQNLCISPLLINDGYSHCRFGEDESKLALRDYRSQTSISFPTICDGFRELIPIKINDRAETDETECTFWSCNNPYTRCDKIWNCQTGIDERNCSNDRNCSSIQNVCIRIQDYTKVCLAFYCYSSANCSPTFHTNNGWFCGENSIIQRQFNCWTQGNFLSVSFICDSLNGYEHDINKWPIHLAHRTFYCNNNFTNTSKTLSCFLSNGYKPRRYSYFTNTFAPGTITINKEILRPMKSTLKAIINKERIEESVYCHRGIPIWFNDGQEQKRCLCPPSYYGHLCQYQNQRVSLTLKIETDADWQTVFTAVIMLVDEEGIIESHDQMLYLPQADCNIFNFNIYLLYRSRPKNMTKTYAIQIHVYDKHILEYRGSWLFPLAYSFLPVHRISVKIIIPHGRPITCSSNCNGHGECVRYINRFNDDTVFYCRCFAGWSGKSCTIKHDTCHLCARDSLCINKNICVCPIGKDGPRCYLKPIACSPSLVPCLNGGFCVPSDIRRGGYTQVCLCPEDFQDQQCSTENTRMRISFDSDIRIPESIRVYIIHRSIMEMNKAILIISKIPFDKNSVVLHARIRILWAFVALSINDYYIIRMEDSIPFLDEKNRSTIPMIIRSSQRCRHIRELLNNTLTSLHLLRRIKYYQLPCQQRLDLECFYDEIHMCDCTNTQGIRQAMCLVTGHGETSYCQGSSNGGCLNGAQCFQDKAYCPTMAKCVCAECFFGKFCQFTSKGFGLSLDAILSYQIQPNISFLRQPLVIRVSALVVTVMGALGLCGSFLSILTFRSKTLREVGCGWYLFVNSIVSFLTIVLLIMKVWLLVLSQMAIVTRRSAFILNCSLMDFLLRISLAIGDWLSTCVAVERYFVSVKGTAFNKSKSLQLMKWMILSVCSLTLLTHLYDPFQHKLLDDLEEQRVWCITTNNGIYQDLNTIVLLFHFFLPFAINILSAISTISTIARQKASVRREKTYKQHIFEQLRQHRHIIIAPCILIVLSLSRLVLSFLPGCMDSPRDPWFFFAAYMISFIPSMLFLVVYVLPSATYKHECNQNIKRICQWFGSLCQRI